jgi:hypothetical protein
MAKKFHNFIERKQAKTTLLNTKQDLTFSNLCYTLQYLTCFNIVKALICMISVSISQRNKSICEII